MVISFKDADLERSLSERANSNLSLSSSLVAKRDLERYYWLLSLNAFEMSTEEFNFLLDALDDRRRRQNWNVNLLAQDLLESTIAHPYLAALWKVDVNALIDRLRNASVAQILFLIDRIEQVGKNRPGPISERISGYPPAVSTLTGTEVQLQTEELPTADVPTVTHLD